MSEGLTVGDGDRVTVEVFFETGDLGVKVQNVAFVEDARWLHVAVAGEHDRDRVISDLIAALGALRTPQHVGTGDFRPGQVPTGRAG